MNLLNIQTQLFLSIRVDFYQAGFIELEIDATFEALDLNPAELKDWMIDQAHEYAGAAITVPYKETVIPYIDKLTDAAKSIGAVNTLYWENDVLHGTNTDCIGALRALQSEVPNLKGKHVLIMGAGGAARAIIFALKTAGCKIVICNRTAEKAVQLAEEFEVEAAESLEAIFPEKIDIVINTTSVGLKEWKSVIPEDFWDHQHTAFDIVYDPMETKFLSDAAQAGAKTVLPKDTSSIIQWKEAIDQELAKATLSPSQLEQGEVEELSFKDKATPTDKTPAKKTSKPSSTSEDESHPFLGNHPKDPDQHWLDWRICDWIDSLDD